MCDDGQVSLDEFKRLATHGDQLHLKTSALWASVRQVRRVLIWCCMVCDVLSSFTIAFLF